jgi:hypothetical protein
MQLARAKIGVAMARIMRNKDLLLTFIFLVAFFQSFLMDKTEAIRAILGFLFVLFLPGYSLTSILFSSNSYNNLERLILSFGLSVALSPIISLLVLKLASHAFLLPCLAFFIIFFSLLAYLKRLKMESVETNSKSDTSIKRKLDRKIILILSASSILVATTAFYFKFFPTIVNPLISDLLITILIFVLSLLLVAGSFLVKTSTESLCMLLPCLMFTFIARIVMYLRLPYPPLWDPYAFLVAFLNIHDYHTLEPVLTWWLPELKGVLPWPLMLLITENLVLASGLDFTYLFRFQEPLLGTLFFLAIFILTKEVAKNDGAALLAGLFSSLASHVIFFQSEYHAQGLVFVLLAFLIYSIIRSLDSDHAVTYRIIALLFVPAIALSHYFSSLFLAIIFASIVFVTNLMVLLKHRVKKWPIKIVEDNQNNALFLTIAISAVSYHIYSYSKHFEEYIKIVFTTLHPYQAEIISVATPFPTNIIKNMRLALLSLALISIAYIWKTRDKKEFYLATFWLSFIIFSVIGNFLIWLEVGRITAFYETVTGVFGALTLFRFRDKWVKSISKSKKTVVAVLTASIIITCSFFGGTYVPAYYFKSFGIDDHYWCSNRLPNIGSYPPAGEWIKTYTSVEAKYVTDRDKYGFTCSLVFFWGERSPENIVATNNLIGEALKRMVSSEQTYLVLNHGYEYRDYENLVRSCDLIYTNGEIGIYTKR